MIKKIGLMVALCFSGLGYATGDEGLSEECLRSMQDLYKFYYYEIQPNPKTQECHKSERLSSTDTLKMQAVISELKQHCPETTIARVNENLKSDAVG